MRKEERKKRGWEHNQRIPTSELSPLSPFYRCIDAAQVISLGGVQKLVGSVRPTQGKQQDRRGHVYLDNSGGDQQQGVREGKRDEMSVARPTCSRASPVLHRIMHICILVQVPQRPHSSVSGPTRRPLNPCQRLTRVTPPPPHRDHRPAGAQLRTPPSERSGPLQGAPSCASSGPVTPRLPHLAASHPLG